MSAPEALYHFSEDPSIRRFVPHVPRTNPDHPPAVWAMDEEHSPLWPFWEEVRGCGLAFSGVRLLNAAPPR